MEAEGLSRRTCSSGKHASPSSWGQRSLPRTDHPGDQIKPVCATNEPKDQTGIKRWGRNEGDGGRCKNKRTKGRKEWGSRKLGLQRQTMAQVLFEDTAVPRPPSV